MHYQRYPSLERHMMCMTQEGSRQGIVIHQTKVYARWKSLLCNLESALETRDVWTLYNLESVLVHGGVYLLENNFWVIQMVACPCICTLTSRIHFIPPHLVCLVVLLLIGYMGYVGPYVPCWVTCALSSHVPYWVTCFMLGHVPCQVTYAIFDHVLCQVICTMFDHASCWVTCAMSNHVPCWVTYAMFDHVPCWVTCTVFGYVPLGGLKWT